MSDYKATTEEFTAVANAIRAKGGTSAQLEWPTGFATAIAAIPTGGGGGPVFATIVAYYPTGAICTATNGTITLTATDTSGTAVFAIPTPASTPETWTVTATLSGSTDSMTVSVSVLGARYEVDITGTLPSEYQKVQYLAVESAGGPKINTGYNFTTASEFEIKAQYTDTPNNNSWLFGAFANNQQTDLGYTSGSVYLQTGGRNISLNLDTNAHVYKSTQQAFIVDGVVDSRSTPNWSNTTTAECRLYQINDGAASNNCRIYYCIIWNAGLMVRRFIPCYRKADNEPGMYDTVNGIFYTNSGTGSFTVGPDA